MNSIQICFAVTCTLLFLAYPTTSHPGAPPKPAVPKAPGTKIPAEKPQDAHATTPPTNAPAAAAKPNTPQVANKMAALSNTGVSAIAHGAEEVVAAPAAMAMGVLTVMEELAVAPMTAAMAVAKTGTDVESLFGNLLP